MSISLCLPLIYLALGIVMGRLRESVKQPAAALLTRWIIPVVIVFNIATHRPGVFAIMIGMVVMMAAMLALSRVMTRDAVARLCLCYLNIGWLGLPVATALFGDGAARVLIPAYVGSSIFGNSVSAAMLAPAEEAQGKLKQIWRSPPVLALAIGIACIPFGATFEQYGSSIYAAAKFLMGLFGMTILGIWLALTPPGWQDFKRALLPFAIRCLLWAAFIKAFLATCDALGVPIDASGRSSLYLLALLPPAANIVILETHYLRSGRSAGMIASGTCLSVVALSFVVICLQFWRH